MVVPRPLARLIPDKASSQTLSTREPNLTPGPSLNPVPPTGGTAQEEEIWEIDGTTTPAPSYKATARDPFYFDADQRETWTRTTDDPGAITGRSSDPTTATGLLILALTAVIFGIGGFVLGLTAHG